MSQKLAALSTSENAKDLMSLGELVAAGKIFPAIDRTYPLSEVPAAVRYVQEGNAPRQGRDHRVSPEVVLCAAGDIPMMETVAAAAEAIARAPRSSDRAPALVAECESEIEASASYADDHLEDPPEIRD